MKLTYVLRSYVGVVQEFGPGITIKPYSFVEVDKAVMDALSEQVKLDLRMAQDRRRVSVAMIKDGQPVASFNEAAVLKEAVGGSS